MSLASFSREDRPLSVLLGGSGISRIAAQQAPKVGALLQARPGPEKYFLVGSRRKWHAQNIVMPCM